MYRAALTIALFLAILFPLQGQDEAKILFSTENRLAEGDQTVSDGSYVDYYQVGIDAGERVAVVVSSEAFDSYLYVTLPDGTQDSNDDYVDWNAGYEFVADEEGTLEFGVSSLFSGESGAYTVRVVSLPEPKRVDPNARVRDTLDREAIGGRRADQYMVTGEEGDRLRIEVNSDDFDAFLELLDSSGRRMSDDDGGEERNARTTYQFSEEGWVVITVTSFDGLSAGSYELLVQEVDAGDATIIEGELGPGDPRAIDGRLYDLVEIPADRGEKVTALLESEEFDAFLYLNFSTGENLDSDDDSGGGSNALIDTTVPQEGT